MIDASRLVWSLGCCALLACSGSAKTGGSSLNNAAGASPVAPIGGGVGGAPNSGSPASAGSGVVLNIDGGLGEPTNADAGGGVQIITSLPPGFQATDVGGFQLGPALGGDPNGGAGGGAGGSATGGAAASANGNCGNVLLGVARDFKREDEGGNPDFESPTFWGLTVTPNLIASGLGPDQKPVYASQCELGSFTSAACPYGAETTTKENFDQWYRDTPNVNLPFAVSLYLAPQAGGLFTFQSLHYYPLDGVGFGLSGTDKDGSIHNFGFTTEIHTQFSYQGGESFEFQGDDDVWVFINGKKTVDLGGLHPALLGTVDLDASAATLGLQKGKVYSLDLFHAERHTDRSTFRIDTNLSFVNCGTTESGPK